ncbi:MAG: exodeoxyribonuclease VII small subunit [Gammaproteobacteria bacterium]|nr:exodeoxyribonuclease VII small subunit [Gammaproteobacteria bacterium]
MASKRTAKKPDFEQSLKKLETIIEHLESGDLPLEKAVKEWEAGMKLRDSCEKILAETQQKVDILINRNGDEDPEDFDAS